MLSSRVVVHFAIVCFVNPNYGLERSREISATTDAIRHVVNDIFSSLKIKMNESNKINNYSAIHKYFVKLTWHENENWNEVLKLSRHDIKINNGSADFMTVINEVLNDENNTEEASDLHNEDNANMCIEYFLSALKKLKENYLLNNSDSTENNEVLQFYYRDRNKTEDNAKATSEKGAKDSEDNIWVPSETRRIFHGERTKIQNYPFVVSVHLFNEFTCAGSIINEDLVITAASCLQLLHNNRFFRENPLSLAVRVGSSYYDVGGEVIPVVEVYFHPLYDPPTLRNNLAIMRLRRRLKFRNKERKMKRIEIDRNNWALPPNTGSITLLGWGAKNTLNKVKVAWQDKLSEAQLDYYPTYECQKSYPKLQVMDKSFCAGFFAQGGGACNRDVGAPGVVHGQLVGVVSFGAPSCGATTSPTVFTKVGFYADWIESIMEQTPTIHSAEPTTRQRSYFYQTIEATMALADNSFTIQPIIRSTTADNSRERNLRTLYDKEFEEFLRNKGSSLKSNVQQTTVKKQAKDGHKKHAQKKTTKNTESLQDADRVTRGSRSSTDTTFELDPFKSTSKNISNLDIEQLYGLGSSDKVFAKERDKVKFSFDDKGGASNERDKEEAFVDSKIRNKHKSSQNITPSNYYSNLLKKLIESAEQTISSNSFEVEQKALPEPELNALQELLLVLDQPSTEDFKAIKENSQGFDPKKLQNSGGFEPKKHHSPQGFHPETQHNVKGFHPETQNNLKGFDLKTQFSPEVFDPKTHLNPKGFHPKTPHSPEGFDPNKLYSFIGVNSNVQHSLKGFDPKKHHSSRGFDRKEKLRFRDFNPKTQHRLIGFGPKTQNSFRGLHLDTQHNIEGFEHKKHHSLKGFEPKPLPNSESYELKKPVNFKSLERKKQHNSKEYESMKLLGSDARNEVIRAPKIKIDGIGLPVRKPFETSIVQQLDKKIDQIIEFISVNKVANSKVVKRPQATDIAVDTEMQDYLKHQEKREDPARNNDILSQLYMPGNTKFFSSPTIFLPKYLRFEKKFT